LTIVGKVLGPQAIAIYARLSMDPQRQAMDAASTGVPPLGKQTALLAPVALDAKNEPVTT
jgi:hypothetical protein